MKLSEETQDLVNTLRDTLNADQLKECVKQLDRCCDVRHEAEKEEKNRRNKSGRKS